METRLYLAPDGIPPVACRCEARALPELRLPTTQPQTGYIRTLTLIPANTLMTVMMGAPTIHGIQFGPHLPTLNATAFCRLVVSMSVGNVKLLIINLPFTRCRRVRSAYWWPC